MSKTSPIVLTPASSDYVLPTRARPTGEVVITPLTEPAPPEHARAGEVVRVLGAHFALLAETQQMFLAEVRERIEALDGSIAESSKAQLKGAVREVLGVLDWCDTLQADLVIDGQRAAGGSEPIDLTRLAQQVAGAERSADQEVLVTGELPVRWWGDATALSHLLRSALELVAERTNAQGTRVIEVLAGDEGPRLRIASAGEPCDSVDAAAAARFRNLAQHVGAVITPDALGLGGAGMVIRLPAANR